MARYEDLSVSLLRVPQNGTATVGPASIYSVSYTPASVATATVADNATTVTLKGVAVGDVVICAATPPIANATALVDARVSATDTVTCRFINPTAGSLSPTAGTYKFLVLKAG
jgi:hypothetical protein